MKTQNNKNETYALKMEKDIGDCDLKTLFIQTITFADADIFRIKVLRYDKIKGNSIELVEGVFDKIKDVIKKEQATIIVDFYGDDHYFKRTWVYSPLNKYKGFYTELCNLKNISIQGAKIECPLKDEDENELKIPYLKMQIKINYKKHYPTYRHSEILEIF